MLVKDILRDGAKRATANSAEVSFSASDLMKTKDDDINVKPLKTCNAVSETAQLKVQTTPELLEAMLRRYKL